MDELNSFFSGGAPSFKFEKHGDTAKGEVISAELQQQRHIDTQAPLTWDDGSPKIQCKVTLATADRDTNRVDDDGHRTIYVKGQMQKAVIDALRKAGAKTIEIGGTLAVEYYGDGEATKRGFTPPKLYRAQFKPAAPASVSVEDLL